MQCDFGSPANYSVFHIAQPQWLDPMEPLQWITLRVNMTLLSGVGGVAFRFTDISNHYYFAVNAEAQTVEFGKVLGGTGTVLGAHHWAVADEYKNATVSITVTSDAGAHTLSITNATGDASSWSYNDSSIVKGTIGLLSQGVVYFDNFTASTSCDGLGQTCSQATTGMGCEFQCGDGYSILQGTPSRTCTAGAWSGVRLVCAIGVLPLSRFPLL